MRINQSKMTLNLSPIANPQLSRQQNQINFMKLLLSKYKKLLRSKTKRANLMGQAMGQTSSDAWHKLYAETIAQIQLYRYQVYPFITRLNSMSLINIQTRDKLRMQTIQLSDKFFRFQNYFQRFITRILTSAESRPILDQFAEKKKEKFAWMDIDIEELVEDKEETETISYSDEKAQQLKDKAKEIQDRMYNFISGLKEK